MAELVKNDKIFKTIFSYFPEAELDRIHGLDRKFYRETKPAVVKLVRKPEIFAKKLLFDDMVELVLNGLDDKVETGCNQKAR